MRYRTVINIVAPFVVLALGGCAKESKTPTILPAKPQSYVQDVPVPAKFNLDESMSDSTSQAGRRSVKHYYLGSSPILAVRNFYVQHMPDAGWQIIDETLQNNVYTLNYRKAEERCEIRVEKIPAGLFKPGTRIRATVRSPHLER